MDGVTEAHGKLLKDTSIQFHFPTAAPAPPPEPPRLPFTLGDGSVVFWTVLAVVAAGLLLVVIGQVRAFRARQPAATPAPASSASGMAIALPRAALAEADALAEAGRYGEAVHALLLRGIGAIEARFPRALAPSLTSRDIAHLPALPDATRHAFTGIAQRTERAVFARIALDRADWDACRTLYAGLLPPSVASRS